ncbi:3-hydroxyacyl-CoA dehydrogenase NAD-binding domain-containing protein [Desulfosporosinus burensis]
MKASDIKKVACIGSGLIGNSWALNFAIKGYEVNVYDIHIQQLDSAKALIGSNMDFLVSKDVLTKEQALESQNVINYMTDLAEAVGDVQLIQESGPEKYAIKQEILATIEENTSKDTIFASSTSGLLISEIAKNAKHPERCLGAHPYNPVHLIPLVELTKGPNTSDEVIKCTFDFYQSIGKEPILLQKEALGFIANRLQVALYREAVDLVIRGVCSVEDVDKAALFGPGLRFGILGPNMIFQLGGGTHGIKGLLAHVGPSVELWWADMADWKKWPANWQDKSQDGVNQAMANRPQEAGNTTEEITFFRNDMLVDLLKLHKKL